MTGNASPSRDLEEVEEREVWCFFNAPKPRNNKVLVLIQEILIKAFALLINYILLARGAG